MRGLLGRVRPSHCPPGFTGKDVRCRVDRAVTEVPAAERVGLAKEGAVSSASCFWNILRKDSARISRHRRVFGELLVVCSGQSITCKESKREVRLGRVPSLDHRLPAHCAQDFGLGEQEALRAF